VLAQVFGNPKLLGTDPSGESLEIARKNHGALAQFSEKVTDDFLGACDLAYCNGVFHHILPAERPAAVAQVASALRPGGYFALWENNPWNPAVRFIMSRVPFDRDAILLRPGETKRLLRDAGFEIVRTDFLFIFPSALKFLRPTEKCLTKLPLGGQYCVLGRLRG
jgi:SAM-dependent methyltransferase